ncbi:hypothetical protein LguiA_011358 [Lonicera macranthoides]
MDDSTTEAAATLTRECDPSTCSSSSSSSYAFSGKLMLISVVILLFVSLLILFFHIYSRWFLFRRSQHHRRFSATLPANSQGLDITVLKSLPIFHHPSKTNGHPPLECAVCLSEFEEKETGCLLPNCNHCFHLHCIDMWFHSHSNCPLCRSPVPPINRRLDDETRLPMSTATATEPAGSAGEPLGSVVGVREIHEDVRVNIEDAVGNSNGFKPAARTGAVG